MDYKSALVPIMGDVVERAMKAAGRGDDNEIKEVKDKIEGVLKDKDVAAKIAELPPPGPKVLPPEPETFDRFRAFVRPTVTLILTVTFVFLIITPFLPQIADAIDKHWDKVFGSFMGVFGTIIGFWFGERSALKVPKTGKGAGVGGGAEGEPEEGAEK
jgi:hypothetical protein